MLHSGSYLHRSWSVGKFFRYFTGRKMKHRRGWLSFRLWICVCTSPSCSWLHSITELKPWVTTYLHGNWKRRIIMTMCWAVLEPYWHGKLIWVWEMDEIPSAITVTINCQWHTNKTLRLKYVEPKVILLCKTLYLSPYLSSIFSCKCL